MRWHNHISQPTCASSLEKEQTTKSKNNYATLWVLTNHLFLISQNIHADLKGPKVKYKLHYGWCKGRRFTAATRHNTSCSEGK